MLRRAENVGIRHVPGMFSGNGWIFVQVGGATYRTAKIHKDEYTRLLWAQMTQPINIVNIGERKYRPFRGKVYWDNAGLEGDQVYALLATKQMQEEQRIERAQAIVAQGALPPRPARGAIPNDVKLLVWTRDQGRCRNCGSTTELQFDHIIPISLGGNSEQDNIQILRGPCNRRKA